MRAAAIVEAVGAALIVAGLALVAVWAALIAAGFALLAAAAELERRPVKARA